MELFFQQLTNGLTVGGIYALMLIYGGQFLVYPQDTLPRTAVSLFGTNIPLMQLLILSAAFLLMAALFALGVTRPIIHLQGDYLCIMTIGIGELVRIALVNNIFGITGSANGIFGISPPEFFGWQICKTTHFFYYIWCFVAVTNFLFRRLGRSRFSCVLNYLSEDDLILFY